MKQQSSGWASSNKDMDYFFRQLDTPYQSTISFFDFLDEKKLINEESALVDACCGSGGNTFYAAKRFHPKHIVGFDYQDEFLSIARDYKSKFFDGSQTGGTEITFCNGDVYNTSPLFKRLSDHHQIAAVDGVIFLQTLSWLTDWRKALTEINNFNPGWIAISSLFYDGLIEAEITIKRYSRDDGDISISPCDVSPYNVYSMALVEKFLREIGFHNFHWQEFHIKLPLEKPNDKDKMGTYTIEETTGRLFQISGPILMPWYFLIAER